MIKIIFISNTLIEVPTGEIITIDKGVISELTEQPKKESSSETSVRFESIYIPLEEIDRNAYSYLTNDQELDYIVETNDDMNYSVLSKRNWSEYGEKLDIKYNDDTTVEQLVELAKAYFIFYNSNKKTPPEFINAFTPLFTIANELEAYELMENLKKKKEECAYKFREDKEFPLGRITQGYSWMY
ncbi:MAG: hypothetical protein ABI863_09835 [Ginsengibacter sp.]